MPKLTFYCKTSTETNNAGIRKALPFIALGGIYTFLGGWPKSVRP